MIIIGVLVLFAIGVTIARARSAATGESLAMGFAIACFLVASACFAAAWAFRSDARSGLGSTDPIQVAAQVDRADNATSAGLTIGAAGAALALIGLSLRDRSCDRDVIRERTTSASP